MNVHYSFGRSINITNFYKEVSLRKFLTLRCWGIFLGNTFIGITRARK